MVIKETILDRLEEHYLSDQQLGLEANPLQHTSQPTSQPTPTALAYAKSFYDRKNIEQGREFLVDPKSRDTETWLKQNPSYELVIESNESLPHVHTPTGFLWVKCLDDDFSNLPPSAQRIFSMLGWVAAEVEKQVNPATVISESTIDRIIHKVYGDRYQVQCRSALDTFTALEARIKTQTATHPDI